MTKDRSYYRACSSKQLILEAKESDSELAIALGERLEDALHDIETADREEIDDLNREIEDLRAEIAALEEEMENAQ